jgi:hypothetical protein
MKTVLRLGLVGVGMLAVGVAVGRYTGPSDPVGGTTGGRPAPRCWEATVYVPLADNAGRPFPAAVWQDALAEFVRPFGGATLGPPQEGWWEDGTGRILREPVRPLVISFAPNRLDEFRAAARDFGRRLGQTEMYLRYEEPRVELVPGTRSPTPDTPNTRGD